MHDILVSCVKFDHKLNEKGTYDFGNLGNLWNRNDCCLYFALIFGVCVLSARTEWLVLCMIAINQQRKDQCVKYT